MPQPNTKKSRVASLYESRLIRWLVVLRRLQSAAEDLLELPAVEAPADLLGDDPYGIDWYDVQREVRGVRWALSHVGDLMDSNVPHSVRERVDRQAA